MTVGMPPWTRIVFRMARELHRLTPTIGLPPNEPYIRVPFVGLQIGLGHRIKDRVTIGRDVYRSDLPYGEEVFERRTPLSVRVALRDNAARSEEGDGKREADGADTCGRHGAIRAVGREAASWAGDNDVVGSRPLQDT